MILDDEWVMNLREPERKDMKDSLIKGIKRDLNCSTADAVIIQMLAQLSNKIIDIQWKLSEIHEAIYDEEEDECY